MYQRKRGERGDYLQIFFTVHIFIVFIRIHPSMQPTVKCSRRGCGLSDIRYVRVSARTALGKYTPTYQISKQQKAVRG